MVNLTAALGGMVIALTVDRIGHRRLVVFGTALCAGASLLGAIKIGSTGGQNHGFTPEQIEQKFEAAFGYKFR